MFPLSVSVSLINPGHKPIQYTDYTCSKIYYFQYIFVMYIALYISYAFDILRNYLSINSTKSHIYVFIFIYVCMYFIVIIKLHCRHAAQFCCYSTVACDYCGVDLFFIILTDFFIYMNQLTFPISHFCTHSV